MRSGGSLASGVAWPSLDLHLAGGREETVTAGVGIPRPALTETLTGPCKRAGNVVAVLRQTKHRQRRICAAGEFEPNGSGAIALLQLVREGCELYSFGRLKETACRSSDDIFAAGRHII